MTVIREFLLGFLKPGTKFENFCSFFSNLTLSLRIFPIFSRTTYVIREYESILLTCRLKYRQIRIQKLVVKYREKSLTAVKSMRYNLKLVKYFRQILFLFLQLIL